jgi:hypothetical protein
MAHTSLEVLNAPTTRREGYLMPHFMMQSVLLLASQEAQHRANDTVLLTQDLTLTTAADLFSNAAGL